MRKLIFDRSFEPEKPDFGNRDDIRIGDHITFIIDSTFMTREVASVNGLIITTKPFPNEKRILLERKNISKITRLEKEKLSKNGKYIQD